MLIILESKMDYNGSFGVLFYCNAWINVGVDVPVELKGQ